MNRSAATSLLPLLYRTRVHYPPLLATLGPYSRAIVWHRMPPGRYPHRVGNCVSLALWTQTQRLKLYSRSVAESLECPKCREWINWRSHVMPQMPARCNARGIRCLVGDGKVFAAAGGDLARNGRFVLQSLQHGRRQEDDWGWGARHLCPQPHDRRKRRHGYLKSIQLCIPTLFEQMRFSTQR